MQRANLNGEELPLDIAGSSTFGRNPKIMASRTFNMILSDNWLIDGYGYKKVIGISNNGIGRGAFSSIRYNRMIFVINEKVYSVGVFSVTRTGKKTYQTDVIGTLETSSGDVFIDENIVGQIGICDQKNVYIYNYLNNTFQKATLPAGVFPSYIAYKDGRFIVPDSLSASWYLSAIGDGLNWFSGSSGEPVSGAIQTKADFALAVFAFPGKGNLITVMGHIVGEWWTDVGSPVFPYQKNTSINADYGCVNQATIAFSDQIVAWLGSNEKSGPTILFSSGGDVQTVSTDGINLRFAQLVNPQKSCAFFVKLAGHLLYQLTFYDKADNYTVVYDFTTQKFFDFTDENQNFHIARKAVFFNNDYYFISLRDGNIYQLDAEFSTYDYGTFADETPKVFEIPRIRVCTNIRRDNAYRFIVNQVTFTMEQGNDTTNDGNDPNYIPVIDMSFSDNGGISFGSYVSYPVYQVGVRQNKLDWWNVGAANDFVCQFRFHGKGPWKCTNGLVGVYQ